MVSSFSSFDPSVYKPPLAIYLHWPFCAKICPYCHFNRFLQEPIEEQKWREAFFQELNFWHEKTPCHEVVSIFWGGGTPSLMPPSLCKDILYHIQSLWSLSPTVEITLEMNPRDYKKMTSFLEAGMNRFSLGVQSFEEESLKILGRDHDPKILQESLCEAQDLGVSYSFDLIYGHEGHKNPDLWQKDLEKAQPWIGHHLSLYQLSYEEQTPFYSKRHLHLEEEELLHLEFLTHKTLEPLGLLPYEVSNYGRPGWESRHNLAYWRYEDFIGVGPGSHGRLKEKKETEKNNYGNNTDDKNGDKSGDKACNKNDDKISDKIGNKAWCQKAFVNEKRPDKWMDSLKTKGHGLKEDLVLDDQTRAYEHLLMSLRLTEGVDLKDVFLDAIPQDFFHRLESCAQNNLLKKEETRVYLTPKGRNVLNEILYFLMPKT